MLEKVAASVLQEPLTISVDVLPRAKWHRLMQNFGIFPRKKTFHIHPATLGTLIRVSDHLISINMDVYDLTNLLESNYKAIALYGRTLAAIIAAAIDNRKASPPKSLVCFIEQNFTAAELLSVLSVVLKQMDVQSFMSSIISVKGMNVLENRIATVTGASGSEVSPLNQAEIIAPGTPSEV